MFVIINHENLEFLRKKIRLTFDNPKEAKNYVEDFKKVFKDNIEIEDRKVA